MDSQIASPAPSGHLFFVHIPKTAGTSLRESLALRWGGERCLLDYGTQSPVTSELIRQCTYSMPDLFRLQGHLSRCAERHFIAGHAPAARYAAVVGCASTFTFLREPVSQLLSHFAHVCRHQGYNHDLATFAASPQGAGLQGNMLAGIPITAMGVVGITERYSETLRVLNATYGLDITHRLANLNPDKSLGSAYPMPEGVSAESLPGIQKDAQLHAQASKLLDQRLWALDQGVPFVNGDLLRPTPEVAEGFAFTFGSDEPVRVRVMAADEELALGDAVENAPHLRGIGVPRNGFVRFALRLKRKLRSGELAQVHVAETGQVLGTWTIP